MKLKAGFQCELIGKYVCKPPQVVLGGQYWYDYHHSSLILAMSSAMFIKLK